MRATHEHEFEAAPGLPAPLPAGERVLWQGAPQWKALAVESFQLRKLAVYFALMLVLQALYLMGEPGADVGRIAKPLLGSLLLVVFALSALAAMAWLSARAALYTVTDRRIVMRVGIVLTLSFNLPYRQLAGASLRVDADGCGDVALQLSGRNRIGWFHLWPHARPWAMRHPQPTLRCIADAATVGRLVQQAWLAMNPGLAVDIGAPAPAADKWPVSPTPQDMGSPQTAAG